MQAPIVYSIADRSLTDRLSMCVWSVSGMSVRLSMCVWSISGRQATINTSLSLARLLQIDLELYLEHTQAGRGPGGGGGGVSSIQSAGSPAAIPAGVFVCVCVRE